MLLNILVPSNFNPTLKCERWIRHIAESSFQTKGLYHVHDKIIIIRYGLLFNIFQQQTPSPSLTELGISANGLLIQMKNNYFQNFEHRYELCHQIIMQLVKCWQTVHTLCKKDIGGFASVRKKS